MVELHKLLPNMMTAGSTVYSSRILPTEKEKKTTVFLYYYIIIYHLYAGYLELYT